VSAPDTVTRPTSELRANSRILMGGGPERHSIRYPSAMSADPS
jgi:hypothetical protein